MQPEFKIAVIASGSRGNATLIKAGEANFLVDAGISCRRIRNGLKDFNLDLEDLDGILITHEHIDHVYGLKTISKNFNVNIYANEETWWNMKGRREIRRECIKIMPKKLEVKGVKVESFDISHDAAHPVGYIFKYNNEKCTYLTDQGKTDEMMYQALEGARTVVLEANYDRFMLKNSSYPRNVQERIMGEFGHLCNETTGEILANLDEMPEQVFLAHLSQENNTGRKALETVKEILMRNNRNETVEFFVTNANLMVSNIRSEENGK